MLGYKKGNKKLLTGQVPLHYPADRVYLDGDPTKTVQDKCARKSDLTNLDLTGTTNTTGSTIASGTYFYLNGVLVKAITAIASGATLTLNTNYEVKTVGDALSDLNRGSVSVTADGLKTYGALLNELYILLDVTKITPYSKFSPDGVSIFPITQIGNNTIRATGSILYDISNMYNASFKISATGSKYVSWVLTANGNSSTDLSDTVPTNGTKLTFYY